VDIGLLTFVTVALLIFAALATVRAVQRRYWEGARARWWWAAILVSLTLIALYFEVGHDRQQILATDAMSAVTDNPDARADCRRFTESFFSLGSYDGYVYQANSDVALIANHSCRSLASYASSDKRNPSLDQILAVHLIAHETMHVNGHWSEAEAECRAVQLSYLVAEKLGATEEQGRALQDRYFAEVYPDLRDDYVSGDCREGGSLDIFPDRTSFP
jgi:hypothetical protein